MLNRMCYNPSLLVKLKNEFPAKFPIIPRIATQPFGNFVHLFTSPNATVQRTHAFALCFATCFPAHNEAFAADVGVSDAGAGGSIFHYALADNYELDVADDGDPAPGHRGGPEGRMVGDAAGDGGELVGRGEEMEGNVG